MSDTFALNHYVWRIGGLSLLKNVNNENETKRKMTTFTTVTNLGANDRIELKWLLAIGYLRWNKVFYFGVGPDNLSKSKTWPGVKLCYRLILKEEKNGTIVAEISGYVDRSGGWLDDAKKCLFTKINADRIVEGDHLVHLWFDVGVDQQITEQQRGHDAASVDTSTVLARLRSTLPQVLSGLESPYYDLVINVGEEKKFYVHRLVLAAHSPVFDTMLSSGAWRERNGEVTIEDAEPSTIEDLLHYVYSENLPDNFDTRATEAVLDLVHFADKYNIDSLKEKIEYLLLRKHCTDDERYNQWVLSERYRMPQLKQACELILSTKLSVFFEKALPSSVGEIVSKKLALKQVVLTTEDATDWGAL